MDTMTWNTKEIVKTNKLKTGLLYTHTGCRENQLRLYKVVCSSDSLAVVTDGLRDLYGAGWCSWRSDRSSPHLHLSPLYHHGWLPAVRLHVPPSLFPSLWRKMWFISLLVYTPGKFPKTDFLVSSRFCYLPLLITLFWVTETCAYFTVTGLAQLVLFPFTVFCNGLVVHKHTPHILYLVLV